MRSNLRNYFRKALLPVVLIGFSAVQAGSYDDFFRAVRLDDAATVRQLLARGFDVNTPDPSGQTGLFIAVREPSPKVASALLASSAINLNLLNAHDESPLMLASLKGELELAKAMVQRGADVNKTGWTPLHYAATAGQVSLIRMLIEEHAYIDAESPNASTPLMMASMYGSLEAVKVLLDEGADPSLKNQQGLTALAFARRANREESVKLLLNAQKASGTPGRW